MKRGLNLKRKYKVGLILILIFIITIIIIIPTSSAQKETIKGEAKIESLKRFNKNIETAGGEAELYWKILNYNKSIDKLTFSIESNGNEIEGIIISPSNLKKLNHTIFNNETGEYHKKIKLDTGKFTFEWLNGNDPESLDLEYEITYQKMGYEESTGCYSGVFSMILLSFAFIGVVVVFTNKNK